MSLLRVARGRMASALVRGPCASTAAAAFSTQASEYVEAVRVLRFAHRVASSTVVAPFHAQLAARTPCIVEEVEALSLSELPRIELSSAPASSSAFLVALPHLTREAILADSTKRKRAKKMNKHKWKKRLKEQRRRSRKDLAQ